MASSELLFAEMPDLVVLRIVDFLGPEDTTRLGMTCRRLHDLLPKFLVMKGEDFSIHGPGGGHWAPELYFDGPVLHRPVRTLSVCIDGWVDQGWGNRKGELFVRLMRGPDSSRKPGGGYMSRVRRRKPKSDAGKDSEVVVEKMALFGVAQHAETSGRVELKEDEGVVSQARPGDWYRFMRNAGGGGGHRLTVRGFRAVAALLDQ